MSLWNTDNETKKFATYVWDFYGRDGIYPLSNGSLTTEDLASAIKDYQLTCQTGLSEWGGGDTVDRERVRDILLHRYNYVWVDATIQKVEQRRFELNKLLKQLGG